MSTRTRAAAEREREHEATLAAIRGEPTNVGQCDGCPAGHSVLCGECGLCAGHCQSNGCGYSPHAWLAYDHDDDGF